MRIPRNWNELTVGQYEDLYPTFTKEYKNPLDKIIEQLMVLSKCSEQEVEQLTIAELEELKKDMEFLNGDIQGRLVKTFKVGGKRYRFETNAKKLKGGSYMTAMHIQENNPHTNLHKVLFNIATPVNWFRRDKKQDIDYEEEIEYFKDIPMSIAYPMVSFFLLLSKALTVYTEDYLHDQVKQMNQKMMELKEDLVKDSDG